MNPWKISFPANRVWCIPHLCTTRFPQMSSNDLLSRLNISQWSHYAGILNYQHKSILITEICVQGNNKWYKQKQVTPDENINQITLSTLVIADNMACSPGWCFIQIQTTLTTLGNKRHKPKSIIKGAKQNSLWMGDRTEPNRTMNCILTFHKNCCNMQNGGLHC